MAGVSAKLLHGDSVCNTVMEFSKSQSLRTSSSHTFRRTLPLLPTPSLLTCFRASGPAAQHTFKRTMHPPPFLFKWSRTLLPQMARTPRSSRRPTLLQVLFQHAAHMTPVCGT
eukprot:scaffold236268_cov10-Tisochrysis_lutea.AAC.1